MPRDAVSRTANFERNGGHKWVKRDFSSVSSSRDSSPQSKKDETCLRFKMKKHFIKTEKINKKGLEVKGILIVSDGFDIKHFNVITVLYFFNFVLFLPVEFNKILT